MHEPITMTINHQICIIRYTHQISTIFFFLFYKGWQTSLLIRVRPIKSVLITNLRSEEGRGSQLVVDDNTCPILVHQSIVILPSR